MKSLIEFLIIAALMFGLAYLFILGWDATEYVDQAKKALSLNRFIN